MIMMITKQDAVFLPVAVPEALGVAAEEEGEAVDARDVCVAGTGGADEFSFFCNTTVHIIHSQDAVANLQKRVTEQTVAHDFLHSNDAATSR
eukprot:CAMPEP_0116577640 /NCGR_PEP_ID=MMETSP0397-20121206/21263_1 /TAXON_ID=216820 /ORGANISM="Cyclophora tenuis, Strain ECT3854" /LENGTH=91 /DNA_ID=CAMNT_0004106941 /DNA_START=300 /DNA_END=575 /DNA_ORIENTATION=-